jgi:hypothetical protein
MPSTGRFDDKRFEFRAKVRVFLHLLKVTNIGTTKLTF